MSGDVEKGEAKRGDRTFRKLEWKKQESLNFSADCTGHGLADFLL